MGTLSAVAFTATTLTKNTKIALAIVAGVVVLLLIAMLVLARRRRSQKAAAKSDTAASPEMPQATAAIPETFNVNGTGALGASPATPPDQTGAAWEAPPPPPPPPPPGGTPPPGTPPSWLPEPDGTPDTLRYWDGFAWTQHVAQRSSS